ncbi:hypothetical protein J0X14_15875 [Muricauda sp. CAU 1633]|uniref:hypothetical protein n=1 Tax=Allomuricauda sp. CAU 1633 TaxID=2816036 RepID=UPI001A8FA2C9|nr:hypothetical protein [Muricauda sp. CAU 1633]MBO0323789.1 hypothetical protein [Muricauda sp. CAU 1633]
MKTKALLFVFILFPGLVSLAQGNAVINDLLFYERLAERDAAYEQSVQFSNEQDERDYWNDQKNFENLLQQKNPKAYQVYISNKAPSYIDHIEQCQSECVHGDFYKREAAFFLLKASQDPLRELSLSNAAKGKVPGQFK